jgi:hypothetical protein
VFVVQLHHLPGNRSLVTLKVHTATCDCVSAASVLRDILKAFVNIRKGLPFDLETTQNLEVDTSQGLKEEIMPSGKPLPPSHSSFHLLVH